MILQFTTGRLPCFSAWHGFKYIDPAGSGAVLPIVHVNSFKTSQHTIYGTMDDKEIVVLFRYVHFHPVSAKVMTPGIAEVGMDIRFVLSRTWITLIKTLLPRSSGPWMRSVRYKEPLAGEDQSPSPGGLCSFYAHLRCYLNINFGHFSVTMMMTTGMGCTKVISKLSHRRLFPRSPGSSPCS